jgi:transposase
MVNETKKLQQALATEMRDGAGMGGRGFSTELRDAVAALVRSRRTEGDADEGIAAGLGLSTQTLRRWAGTRSSSAPPAAFRAIAVVARNAQVLPGSRDMVVQGPSGLRIEGLSLEQALQVWRGLL